jgi:hypothetical protein
MNGPEMQRNDEAASAKERVSVDTKIEKGQKVGFDMGEIQQRMARMQELEGKVLPEQSKQVVALKRELETMNQEYLSLQENVNMGIASFADLQRFEAVQAQLQSKQAELAGAEQQRAESRRELAVLDPEGHGDLYQMERAQAESSKSVLKKAVGEMDENMIDKIKGQISKKKN